jgi:hypothetical protein
MSGIETGKRYKILVGKWKKMRPQGRFRLFMRRYVVVSNRTERNVM